MEENKEVKFEVIYAVLNNGFADQAMIAAREAGARGGTIIHARGSSNIGVDKKYGITLTPEKEVLMILTTDELKDGIMKAIHECLVREDHKGIVFSLPVESTSGLHYEKYQSVEKHQ